jgi:hypothetical protein
MKKCKRPAATAPATVAKRFLPIPNPPVMHPKRALENVFTGDDDQDGTRGDICTLSYFEAAHGQRDGIDVGESGDRGKRISSRISSVNRHWLRAEPEEV